MKGQHKDFNCLDIIGTEYNSLTVLSYSYSKKNKYQFDYFYNCRCKCGNEIIVSRKNLINGITKSCGCKNQLEDLTGRKFGKLFVIFYDETLIKGKGRKCICKCDCGNTIETWDRLIRYGNKQSCGCLEAIRTQGTFRHGYSLKKHKDRLYTTWANMKNRCSDIYNKHYKNYGGRGIKVCNEWNEDFVNFKNWALNSGYKENLTIDRIDNNGNYCPENCRWVDRKVQGNNKRNCFLITYSGKTQTLAQWSEQLKINRSTIKYKLSKGISFESIVRGAK